MVKIPPPIINGRGEADEKKTTEEKRVKIVDKSGQILFDEESLALLFNSTLSADYIYFDELPHNLPDKETRKNERKLIAFQYNPENLMDELIIQKISDKWAEIKGKNHRAFPGDTVRLVKACSTCGSSLCLDVLPCNYGQSQILTWLGSAMVPITSDGYILMQGHKNEIAATIGAGTRVPGCTPPYAKGYIDHIITEMWEEFGVTIKKEQLTLLGLLEVLPPIASHHHGLIFKVKLNETLKEVKEKHRLAPDRKKEGSLVVAKLGEKELLEILKNPDFAKGSKVILTIVAKSELDNLKLEIC